MTRLKGIVRWSKAHGPTGKSSLCSHDPRRVGCEVNFNFAGGAWTTNDAANHRIAFLTTPGINGRGPPNLPELYLSLELMDYLLGLRLLGKVVAGVGDVPVGFRFFESARPIAIIPATLGLLGLRAFFGERHGPIETSDL